MDHDVLIVGGGPAAHNAALVFGRSRVRVLVCDDALPRNRVAAHSHTFFSRDGTPPLELRQAAIEQLAAYETVHVVRDRVVTIDRAGDGFRATFDSRDPATARLVLLACGVVDRHPRFPGFEELWGETVIHCPYCHGYEVRDQPWGVYVTNPMFFRDLPKLGSWSSDVVVIVPDDVDVPDEVAARIDSLGYALERGSIAALRAVDGRLESIELAGGRTLPRKVLLYPPPQEQTAIVQSLGLELDDMGYVVVDETGQTSAPGIFASGDLTTPRQQIALAAAAGLKAAVFMHGALSSPQSGLSRLDP